MAHRNDDKLAHLRTLTGMSSGDIDLLERQWLLSVVVTPSGEQINDLWYALFVQQGATALDYNGAAYQYLIALTVPAGALPDMWAYAWQNDLVSAGAPSETTVVDDQGRTVVDDQGRTVILG